MKQEATELPAWNDLRKVHPFIKCAGGKRQLLPELDKMIPSQFNRYFEPFFGGGAMFFHLVSSGMGTRGFIAYLSDLNAELITTYKVVRDNPKLLQKLLQGYKNEYMKYATYIDEEEDYYYLLRDLYNNLVLYRKNNHNLLQPQSIKSNYKKYMKYPPYSKERQEYYK
jgi:site-specific DNA-adenine methylase